MRRWFVDPLTSFDAGAIALAVAERRTRQPKQLDQSDMALGEEIAPLEEVAKDLEDEIIEKEVIAEAMLPENGDVPTDQRAPCPPITRLCNTTKMR